MGRPPIGEKAMTAAERKRRQVELERAGHATEQAVDRALVRVFQAQLWDDCTNPKGRSATALSIARLVVGEFPPEQRNRVALRLGFPPPAPGEGEEQMDIEEWLGKSRRPRADHRHE